MTKPRKKPASKPDRLRARRRKRRENGRRVPGTNATSYPCSCGCGGEVVAVPPDELTATLDAMTTDEDRVWLEREVDAAARGDAAVALEASEHGPQVQGSTRRLTLDYLARVGNDAAEWLVARWVRSQAYEWMLVNEDPRVTEAALSALVTHPIPDEPDVQWFREYGNRVAACDVLCAEAALHADGGFRDFIEVRAGEELLDRAGRVREWPNQPLGVYEYLGLDRDVLTVREYDTGHERRVLHRAARPAPTRASWCSGGWCRSRQRLD